MQTIDLKFSHLKAALIIAPKNSLRLYLNGVLIDVLPRAVRIVSTNNHCLACFHHELAVEFDLKPSQIIVPYEILKDAKAAHRSQIMVALQYDSANPQGPCTFFGFADGDRVFTPLQEKYPAYQKLLLSASKPSGERAHFNPRYLTHFCDISDVACGAARGTTTIPEIYENGKNGGSAVKIRGVPEFYGLVMPVLYKTPEWQCPAWLAT